MDEIKALETFLEYKKRLDNSRINEESDYEKEFKIIRERSSAYKSESKYKSEEGSKDTNTKKNRFKDILPYDCTRVPIDSSAGSDYINANFIKGISGSNTYIATQGPMPHTVNDFWHMLWQYHIGIVIMACNEFENKKPRCHRYWPRSASEVAEFGCFQVRLADSWVRGIDNQTTCRELRVFKDGEERQVWQFHYQSWPDYGVPEHSHDILQMLDEARSKQPHDNIPIVVHCSAGCGRTGTIIAIDYARCLINTKKLTADFRVLEMVDHMRQQRPAIVQAVEQYIFLYQAIGEMCERQLLQVRGPPSYENVSIKPKPDKPVNKPTSNATSATVPPQIPHKKHFSGAELDLEVPVQDKALLRSTTDKPPQDKPTPLPKPQRYSSVTDSTDSKTTYADVSRPGVDTHGVLAVSNALYTDVPRTNSLIAASNPPPHETMYAVVHGKHTPNQHVSAAPEHVSAAPQSAPPAPHVRPSQTGEYQMIGVAAEYAEIGGSDETGHVIGRVTGDHHRPSDKANTAPYAFAGWCPSTDESSTTYEAYEVNTPATSHHQRTTPDVYHQGQRMNYPHTVAPPKFVQTQLTLANSREETR